MMINARNLFEKMPEKKLISWNTFIAKLVDFEDYLESSKLFLLIRDDFSVNGSRTFTMLIWASAELRLNSIGRQLHLCAWKMNIDEDIIVSCGALIDMFSKCGSIEDAQWVFENVLKKTIVGWNCYNEEEIEVIVSNELELLAIQTCHIVNYYSGNVPNQEGQSYGVILVGEYQKKAEKLEKALLDTKIAMHDGDNNVKALFRQGQAHMTLNDGATIASMLLSCSRRKLLEIGKQLQTYALRHDTLINNSFVVGALVDWYYNCCRVQNGHCVFYCVPYTKTSLWNTRIIGYTQNKHDDNTLMLFIEMKIVNELCSKSTTMANIVLACVCSEAFFYVQMFPNERVYYAPGFMLKGVVFDGAKAVRKMEKWLIKNHSFQLWYGVFTLDEKDF